MPITKEEFIRKAKEAGKSKEETAIKFKALEAQGYFDGQISQETQGDTVEVGLSESKGKSSTLSKKGEFSPVWAPRSALKAKDVPVGSLEGGISMKGETPKEVLKNVYEQLKPAIQATPAGVKDVMSIPGRAVASIPALIPGGETFKEAMSRTGGKGEGLGALPGNILRSPTLPAAFAVGPVGKGIAGLIGTGAAEGAVETGLGEVSRAVETGEVNPLESAKRIGAGAVLGGATAGLLEGGKKVVGGAAKFANKAVGRLAEELSGVSEEALRKFGFGVGEGAKQLKEASGSQRQIGEKILNALDNFDEFLPEKPIIDEALENMPPVNIGKTIAALEEAIPDVAIGRQKELPRKISEYVQDFVEAADEQGNIPAKTFRRLRIGLDDEIGDAFAKDEAGALVNALKQARYKMAESLTETAEQSGNPQYAEAMRSMANKMRIIDDLKGYVGKSEQARNRKIQGFIDNLFGKNKEDAQRVVSELGEVLGDDFINESKLARLAGELGPEGAPGFIPRQATGRSGLGLGAGVSQIATGLGTGNLGLVGSGVGTLGLTSPRVASGTLSALGGVEKGIEKATEMDPKLIRAALRGLTEDQQKELFNQRR